MMPSRCSLSRMPILAAAAIALLLASAPAVAADGNLGVNVFGFSHHLKNPYGDELHEFNPGLGLQWTFARDGRGSVDGNVGIYSDTFGRANYHLSLGGRVRVAGPLDIGVQMINAVSASLADGEPVLTPYPFLAARLGRVTWNVAYIPEVQSFNAMPAVATFVTVRPWRDDDSDGEAAAPAAAEAPGAGSALEFTVPRVPALSGLHERGFIWRHMFDDRRGLRLGFELLGTVTTSHHPDATYGPDGEYEASLLTQYLWRQAPRGRWRTYWATGLEVQFLASSYYSSSVLETWRTDLGAECTLGGGLALAAEYGVRLEYNAYPAHGGPGEVSRSLNLTGSSGRLALVVTRPDGRTATAAAVAGTMAGSGPVVLLGSDFTLAPFEGAAFAWQWRPASSAGWRLAATPQARNHHDGPSRAEKYALGLRLERLHYRRGSGAAAYWGLGALAAFDYNSSRSTEVVPDFEVPNWIRRRFHAGATAVLGVEYPLTRDLCALAEYSCDLLLTFSSVSDAYRESSWSVATNPVRLGLAAVF
jgi:hypothetical protein